MVSVLTAKQYYNLITDAETNRKKYCDMYDKYIRWMNGRFSSNQPSEITKHIVNYISTHVGLKVPNLIFGTPYVITKPNSPEIEIIKAAEGVESILNNVVKEVSLYNEATQAVTDSLLWFGVLKIGWNVESTPNDADGSPEFVNKNKPFAIRFSPKDTVWQKGSQWNKSDWIAFRIRRNLADVLREKKYKNTDKITASEKHYYNEGTSTASGTPAGEDTVSYVKLWEVWDKKRNAFLVLSESGVELFRGRWPYPITQIPCSIISLNYVPETYVPIGDVHHWETQQEALNLLWQNMMESIRRFLPQYLSSRDNLDADSKAKLEAGVMAQILECDDPDNVKPMMQTTFPESVIVAFQTAQNSLYEVSGVSAQDRGITTKTKSATESSNLQANSQARLAMHQNIVKESIIRTVDIMFQLMQQLLDPNIKNYFPELNEDTGTWDVVIWDKEAIRGNFQIDIQMDSGELESKDRRKKDALALWDLAIRNPQPDPSKPVLPNFPELWKEVIKVLNYQNPKRFVSDEFQQVQDMQQQNPMLAEAGQTAMGMSQMQGGPVQQGQPRPDIQNAMIQALNNGRPRGTFGPQQQPQMQIPPEMGGM